MQPQRASVVVIGGGVTGCSVAYHLAAAGVRDVLLVEKAELTSGSTCHAAGLVTQFNPSPTMMAFRRYSVELYHRAGRVRRHRQPAHRLDARRAWSSCAAAPAGRAGSASTSR